LFQIYKNTLQIKQFILKFMVYFIKLFLMRGKASLVLVLCMFIAKPSFSQSAFWNLDMFSNYSIERLELRSGQFSNTIHNNLKPIARNDLGVFLDSLKLNSSFSKVDKANIQYFKNENWENIASPDSVKKGYLNNFFKRENDFYFAANSDFDIHVAPVIYAKVGVNSAYGDLAAKNITQNTRGFEVRGSLGKKLGFYAYITENIVNSPNLLSTYYNDRGKGYPFQGLVKIKNDDSKTLNVDYFAALGYIRFKPIKNVGLSFGHDRMFIGNGLRSMILSDFSMPFLNFRIDAKIGRLQLINILGQMTDAQVGPSSASEYTFPPKFLVFHSLNLNVTKKLNISAFEHVLFGKRPAGFELNYLNPIIFYRFVEGNIGSSDNAMIGLDSRFILNKSFSFYGQFVLDEYNKKEYKKDGSWIKKFAWQLGSKYLNVAGIKNLDLQYEYNLARPFTYSHFTTATNYINYNVPIAHPLGANFKEQLIILRYQPFQKLYLQATHMRALKGEDQSGLSYGGNLLLNNRLNKAFEYGNKPGQGFTNHIVNTEVLASYRLYSTIFIDATAQLRSDSYQKGKLEQVFQIGLRWNQPYRQFLF
jgi:Capsule assembly protein Wzi